MRIVMAGIDHNRAAIEHREAFAFTKDGVKTAIAQIKALEGVDGCLLLSTCNRTELWISGGEDHGENQQTPPCPRKILCGIKGLDESVYAAYFTVRENEAAVEHLLETVCGFESRIFGEDQIISQVREALLAARAQGTADAVIEKTFQTALSAGKKVKTQVKLAAVNPSSAGIMVELLKEKLGSLQGVDCLVIGNGKMGRLAAKALADAGAQVSMTLRRHMHCQEPQEVFQEGNYAMIPYENRLQEISKKPVIVSATLSPHYTLTAAETAGLFREEQAYYLFDLAVPRDIEAQIGELPNVALFDIDSMGCSGLAPEKEENLQAARGILKAAREELMDWFHFREYVPAIQEILEMVSEDTLQRVKIQPSQEELIEMLVEEAVKKATGKMIFGLKETLPRDLWEICLQSLHQSAARDTLKH